MAEIKLNRRHVYVGDVYRELTQNAGFDHDTAIMFLDNLPTADVQKVRHGEWKQCDDWFVCTNCGKITDYHISNYCPNCGVKMDGKGDA